MAKSSKWGFYQSTEGRALLASGLSDQEIARQRGVSVQAVQKARRRLGIRSRGRLVQMGTGIVLPKEFFASIEEVAAGLGTALERALAEKQAQVEKVTGELNETRLERDRLRAENITLKAGWARVAQTTKKALKEAGVVHGD